MKVYVHNSLILPPPTNCTGNRREAFLFVFNPSSTLNFFWGHFSANQICKVLIYNNT